MDTFCRVVDEASPPRLRVWNACYELVTSADVRERRASQRRKQLSRHYREVNVFSVSSVAKRAECGVEAAPLTSFVSRYNDI